MHRLSQDDKIRLSEFLYRTLAESSQDLIFLLTPQGEVEFISRAARWLLDCPPSADRSLGQVFLPSVKKKIEESLSHVVARHEMLRVEGQMDLVGGHSAWMELVFVPFKDSRDLVALVLVIGREVGEQERVHTALEETLTRLKEAGQNRNDFVVNLSHELKTPLTSMTYAVNNLLKGVAGPLSKEMEQYVRLFEGECRRMLKTVNDILDLRRVESGELPVYCSPVLVERVIGRMLQSLRTLADSQMQTLTVSVEKPKCWIMADQEKLERVVQNIIDNAIKFTPPGGRIDVIVGGIDSPVERTGFAVKDNGIGIPPEAIGHVTERYFRAGNHPAGSGLGLSISKRIIDLHGGRLEVFSPVPHEAGGTLVQVTFPRVAAPFILVVDDDLHVLKPVEDQLTEIGFRVAMETDLDKVPEAFGKQAPDLIMVNMDTKGMGSMDLILRLKGMEKLSNVPLLATTSGGIEQAQISLLHNFAIPLVVAPWDIEDVVRKIETAFARASFLKHPSHEGKADREEVV